MHRALGSVSSIIGNGYSGTNNISTWKVEVRGPKAQGHSQLHGEFKASLSYIEDPVLDKQNMTVLSTSMQCMLQFHYI